MLAAYRSLRIRWEQPDLGTGQLLHYEWRVGSGPWHSTQSQETETEIIGARPRHAILNYGPGRDDGWPRLSVSAASRADT